FFGPRTDHNLARRKNTQGRFRLSPSELVIERAGPRHSAEPVLLWPQFRADPPAGIDLQLGSSDIVMIDNAVAVAVGPDTFDPIAGAVVRDLEDFIKQGLDLFTFS